MLRILLGIQLRQASGGQGHHGPCGGPRHPRLRVQDQPYRARPNAVREIDVADLLTMYGVSERAEREQLLSLASQANRPGWWYRYNDILPVWFQSYIGLEEAAESIRVYEPQFVPGLLQTEEYATAVSWPLVTSRADEAERPRHRAQGTPAKVRGGPAAAVGGPGGGSAPPSGRTRRGDARSSSSTCWGGERAAPKPHLQNITDRLRLVGHAAPGGYGILRFADPRRCPTSCTWSS